MPSVSSRPAMEDFPPLTEKDFLISMVRELSRVYVGKTNGQENIWNKTPNEWDVKELGKWKNPTSTPKDSKPLLVKKLDFLQRKVRSVLLPDALKEKLELYSEKKIKDALQYMQMEKDMKNLNEMKKHLSECDIGNSGILQGMKTKLESTLKETCKVLSDQNPMPGSVKTLDVSTTSKTRKRKKEGPDHVTHQALKAKLKKPSSPRQIRPKAPNLCPMPATVPAASDSGVTANLKILTISPSESSDKSCTPVSTITDANCPPSEAQIHDPFPLPCNIIFHPGQDTKECSDRVIGKNSSNHFQNPACISSTSDDPGPQTVALLGNAQLLGAERTGTLEDGDQHSKVDIFTDFDSTARNISNGNISLDLNILNSASSISTHTMYSVDSGLPVTDDESCSPVDKRLEDFGGNSDEEFANGIESAIEKKYEDYSNDDCVCNPEEYLGLKVKENSSRQKEFEEMINVLGL